MLSFLVTSDSGPAVVSCTKMNGGLINRGQLVVEVAPPSGRGRIVLRTC